MQESDEDDDRVQALFNRARQAGAAAGTSDDLPGQESAAFKGTGYTLGGGPVPVGGQHGRAECGSPEWPVVSPLAACRDQQVAHGGQGNNSGAHRHCMYSSQARGVQESKCHAFVWRRRAQGHVVIAPGSAWLLPWLLTQPLCRPGFSSAEQAAGAPGGAPKPRHYLLLRRGVHGG